MATCPYPLHELLTHLVLEHGLLLHGSNDSTLGVLEPRPARDWDTELHAVAACDDGIWPIFYAVVGHQRDALVRTEETPHCALRPSLEAAPHQILLAVVRVPCPCEQEWLAVLWGFR